jgi:GTP1/Obg family GTP-binding protein
MKTHHDELVETIETLKDTINDETLSVEEKEDKVEELKVEALDQVENIYENFDCLNERDYEKLVDQISDIDELSTSKGVENRAENIIAKINDKVYL